MREAWVNCYRIADGGPPLNGGAHSSRALAVTAWARHALPGSIRVHVRLKPEGAPRRYATVTEQDAWEIDPVGSRYHAQQGNSLRYSVKSGFYVANYNLQKTEDRHP